MVVTLPLSLRLLFSIVIVGSLSAAAQSPQFVPSQLPCTSQLTFKHPPTSAGTNQTPVVLIGERVLSATDTGGMLSVTLVLESDCGHDLQIKVNGLPVNTFQIAPIPEKPGASHENNSAVPPAAPSLFPYSLILAAATLVIAATILGFVVALWLMQWRRIQAARNREPKQVNLSEDSSSREMVKATGKELKSLTATIDRLVGRFNDLDSTTATTLAKVETVMRTLAKSREQTVTSPATEPVRPQTDSTSAYAPPAPARSSSASFALSFNAAQGANNREEGLPGVQAVQPVDTRPSASGDKTPSPTEPLVPAPNGLLRIFVMADLPSDQAYLAPSFALCAEGIGGTHKRAYGALFDFPGEQAATRLDKAALVKRVNNQWEIDEKGQMS